MTTAHNCPELTAVQGDLIISQRGSREDYNVVVPPPPSSKDFCVSELCCRSYHCHSPHGCHLCSVALPAAGRKPMDLSIQPQQ